MPSPSLPDRAASQSPRQAPADTRCCPDRNGALPALSPRVGGCRLASGPSASMGPEPQPTRGAFHFYRHNTDTIKVLLCLLALGASARAERQPPSPDTPPCSSNMSKDRSLEPPPVRGSSFFKGPEVTASVRNAMAIVIRRAPTPSARFFRVAQKSLIVSAGRTSANLYGAHEGRNSCERR